MFFFINYIEIDYVPVMNNMSAYFTLTFLWRRKHNVCLKSVIELSRKWVCFYWMDYIWTISVNFWSKKWGNIKHLASSNGHFLGIINKNKLSLLITRLGLKEVKLFMIRKSIRVMIIKSLHLTRRTGDYKWNTTWGSDWTHNDVRYSCIRKWRRCVL